MTTAIQKIINQKTTLKALAVTWETDRLINETDRNEILAIVDAADITDFRPLIYAIPYGPVAARVRLVQRSERAGHSPEYRIEDLSETEFQIIEPTPCR